ncbi:MULE transposase domain [Sesbania bispinosa]|nr:MULE transposase domain [Sesbania bispinosa]
MMEDRGNRVNEGEGEDVNNLKSPKEENVCFGEAIPDVYKRISELTDDEIRMLEFDSELDAYNFYCEYAKFKDFAVRKDDVYRDRNRFITMRQLVCNRQGERSEKHLNRRDRIREAKAITRTNCLARLRLYLDNNSGKWRVGMFESQHNHELTPANMVHLMPAYRGLSAADKAQVNSLHLYGVRTCHIMGLIMGQKGGHSDLGFSKYDSNPMSFVKFTTTEDDRLENLFWADVVESFLEAMFNKVPKAVVTDRDGAMREATRSVFPGSIHRLCSWHLHLNSCENVKNPKFLEDFKKLIYANFTPEKFEQEWVHVIEKHGLSNNRHNELASDFKSTYTQPVLTTALEKYEVHACNIVTMKMNKFGSPNFVYVVLFDKSVGDTTKKEVLRSGAVGAACNRLNKAAYKNPYNFVKNIEAIHQLADQMERQDGVDVNIADISRVVRDPTIVKTKGAPCKKEESSVESDGESRDVMDTHNHDSLARSKGVTLSGHGKSIARQGPLICKKSNKRMKHNDAVKLTQEFVNDRPQLNDVTNVEMRDCSRSMDHVNHMSHQNIDVNYGFRFIHNDLRFTGTYQYQPSMLPHFGHAQFSSRVHIMPQYPSMPVQQAFHNTTMFHEINTFGSHDPQQLTTGVNEVQRKTGVGISFFNPREN